MRTLCRAHRSSFVMSMDFSFFLSFSFSFSFSLPLSLLTSLSFVVLIFILFCTSPGCILVLLTAGIGTTGVPSARTRVTSCCSSIPGCGWCPRFLTPRRRRALSMCNGNAATFTPANTTNMERDVFSKPQMHNNQNGLYTTRHYMMEEPKRHSTSSSLCHQLHNVDLSSSIKRTAPRRVAGHRTAVVVRARTGRVLPPSSQAHNDTRPTSMPNLCSGPLTWALKGS